MKIIHCLNHFFPGQIAGTEVYTLSLIKELQRKNIECVVLIPNYGKANNNEYEVKGVKVIKYAEPSVVDKALLMGKRKPEGLAAFGVILKQENPSVVHFHEFTSGNGITQYHIALAKEMGYKVVMTFHLSGYSCKTGNLMYKDESLCDGIINIKKCTDCVYTVKQIPSFQKGILSTVAMIVYRLNYDSGNWGTTLGTAIGFPFIIKKIKDDLLQLADDCNRLVVLTDWYKKILEKNGIEASKIIHIPQGLPGEIIAKRSTRVANKPLRLVYIGRITPVKAVHLLIEAMKGLPAGDVSLDIYGELNDDEYIIACKNASASLHNINWKGSIPPETVVNVLSGYDVLCLPSAFSEMSPLVIREAFAAGISILASDVYGNAEQVTDNVNGWLFKFKNSSDLRLKLEMLLQDPSLVKTAKQHIPAVRTFAEVGNEYETLYKNVLEHA